MSVHMYVPHLINKTFQVMIVIAWRGEEGSKEVGWYCTLVNLGTSGTNVQVSGIVYQRGYVNLAIIFHPFLCYNLPLYHPPHTSIPSHFSHHRTPPPSPSPHTVPPSTLPTPPSSLIRPIPSRLAPSMDWSTHVSSLTSELGPRPLPPCSGCAALPQRPSTGSSRRGASSTFTHPSSPQATARERGICLPSRSGGAGEEVPYCLSFFLCSLRMDVGLGRSSSTPRPTLLCLDSSMLRLWPGTLR